MTTTKTKIQFAREDSAARVRVQGRPMKKRTEDGKQGRGDDKWSTLDILGELLRWMDGSYLLHFKKESGMTPMAPIFIPNLGMDASQIKSWHEDFVLRSAKLKVETQRREETQRQNTPVLVSMVVSFAEPHLKTLKDIFNMKVDEKKTYFAALVKERQEVTLKSEAFIMWRDACVAWVTRRYGADKIVTACIHYDESHLHMHFLAHNNGHSVKPLMASHKAAAEFSKLNPGASRKEIQEAGNAGNSAMLDDFQREVGKACGMERMSLNPRKHLSTKQLKNFYAMESIKEFQDDAMRMKREAEQVLREATEHEAQITRWTESLEAGQGELNQMQIAFKNEKTRVIKQAQVIELKINRIELENLAKSKLLEEQLARADVQALMSEKDTMATNISELLADLIKHGVMDKSIAAQFLTDNGIAANLSQVSATEHG
ncbi:MAG: plasmid recombination protein [Burkholderiaceae bacterium]|nr:plasmid recombination protein [Burkholderiaceae bacterium]